MSDGHPPAGQTTTFPRPAAASWARRLRDEDLPVPRVLRVVAAWGWRLLVVAAALYALLWLFSRLQVVILPIVAAMLIATILGPVVDWLHGRGLPRALATWIALLGFVGVLAGLFFGVYLAARSDVDRLRSGIDDGLQQIEDWLVTGPLDLQRSRVEDLRGQATDWLTSPDGLLQTGLLSRALTALEVLAGVALGAVLLFFLLKDGPQIWRWLTSRLGGDAGPHVYEAGMRAWGGLGSYIRGQTLVALIDAVFIGLGIWLLGVPLALPLALITFVAAYFPILGAVVAGALAVLVALAANGFVTALAVLGVVIAVQQIEGNVLQPMIMSRLIRLHPIAVLVALGAGGALGGLVGAFLAVPIAAAVTAAGGYTWARVGPEPAEELAPDE